MNANPQGAATPALKTEEVEQQGTPAVGAGEQTQQALLDTVIQDTFRREEDRKSGQRLIDGFLSQALQGALVVSEDTQSMLAARIAQIDALVSRQLDQFLHHPDFQRLESTWRGLKFLLDRTETGENQRIRVFNVKKKELSKSFENSPEVDQSPFFRKVYKNEYGVYGGNPFGLLVGDYDFDYTDPDMYVLESMAGVAAAAHAPFIASASPQMFRMDSFEQMPPVRDLASIFRGPEYSRWRAFRESMDSRYISLTAPRMLLRLSYGQRTKPVENLAYEEGIKGKHANYLWGNSAFGLASRMTDAFAQYGWCSAIVGTNYGRVADLPVPTFTNEAGVTVAKCPTEISIDETRDRELEELGFSALVHFKQGNHAVFFGVPSCNKPKKYEDDKATASAFMSSQLPYTMAVARFAHYLKVIVRDHIGEHLSRDGMERLLNAWIRNYAVDQDDAPEKVKAEHPLREARVEVSDVKGKPGYYKATAYLRPHYQLKGLDMSLRLVTELPQQKG